MGLLEVLFKLKDLFFLHNSCFFYSFQVRNFRSVSLLGIDLSSTSFLLNIFWTKLSTEKDKVSQLAVFSKLNSTIQQNVNARSKSTDQDGAYKQCLAILI